MLVKAVLAALVVGALGAGCGAGVAGGAPTHDAGARAGAGGGGESGGDGGRRGDAGEQGGDAAVEGAFGTGVDAAGAVEGGADVTRDSDAMTDGPEAGGGAAGTIVPLYTYPGDASWTAIIGARLAHPSVRVVAIVNPNSGPGASRDAAFTTGIGRLLAADIQVIGYVATGYASHSVASMEAAIDTWRTSYPNIGGIFFDEQSDKAADAAYYRTLSEYAKAHGLPYTVGNPGTDTAEAYIGALDTMLIYESKGLPDLAKLGGWHAKYAPQNFGVIPYGASFDAAFVKAARQFVGFVYVQNDDLPNPWDTLPPFFGDLLAALE
jgi:Spherulation-specific family 4